MQHIRFYQFSPKLQPPAQSRQLYQWFKTEVANASIEPVDTFAISNKGPIHGSNKNLSLANKLYEGILSLQSAFKRFKKRL